MRKDVDPKLPPGVQLRISATARRVSLRVDASKGVVLLIVPRRVSLARAAVFAQENRRWIGRKLAGLPAPVPFADGAEVPVGGVIHTIRHRGGMRGTVWIEGQEIHVAGRPEHLARRLTDWLKAEAKRQILALVERHAAVIGRRPGRLTLRDTTTRWGSCSPNGALAFCWRLILAPKEVMDYVVAHEMAHLVELNHGPRFWTLVRRLVSDVDGPKGWLSRHGIRLHRYG
ncbi:MAG: M48 family metallopeptidase [Alphaproteobacteria bacterium]|nr:M48 family metallopeptidase [Alphaproteobacteria bacterium]